MCMSLNTSHDTYDRYRSDFVRNVSTDFQTYSAILKENQIVQSVQSQETFALRLYCSPRA